jgi:CBS-domain-containing membrane protein
MINYHALETAHFKDLNIKARSLDRPELVHLEDPATSVLWDFNKMFPHIGGTQQQVDHALEEMNSLHAHWLIIVDEEHKPAGILSSNDVLGEKPTQVIKNLKITRGQIINKMIMTPIFDVPCMDAILLKHAKVGNIVSTMKKSDSPYLLVVEKKNDHYQLSGLFYKSQINNQLHNKVF